MRQGSVGSAVNASILMSAAIAWIRSSIANSEPNASSGKDQGTAGKARLGDEGIGWEIRRWGDRERKT
jgi:hypothetical protein